MWIYLDKKQTNAFLLSLNLINQKETDIKKLQQLYAISNHIERNYKVFKIKKHNGKSRTIFAPKAALKRIQRNILKNVLEERQISSYAKAYCKKVCLRENAIPHLNQNLILKLDIEDFFGSISFMNIYNKCFSLEFYPKQIGMLLTYLCTYDEYLPQGAPTSAFLSNLVMRDFDEVIGNYCSNHNINYTRYSDDLTFSGLFEPSKIIKMVRKELYKLGLVLNNEKTHVITHAKQQNVTGVVVNEKIQVSSFYRKKIRQNIYYIKKFGIRNHLERTSKKMDEQKYLAELYGKVIYVLQINPDDMEFQAYRDYLKKMMN